MHPFTPRMPRPGSGKIICEVFPPFSSLLRAFVLSRFRFFVTPCRPPGSSVYGILQARILEWVAMPSSRGSSWPRDQTSTSYISCIGRRVLYHWCHLGSPVTFWLTQASLDNAKGEKKSDISFKSVSLLLTWTFHSRQIQLKTKCKKVQRESAPRKEKPASVFVVQDQLPSESFNGLLKLHLSRPRLWSYSTTKRNNSLTMHDGWHRKQEPSGSEKPCPSSFL